MNIWSRVLDSCPGLLCCVVNLRGKLLYASHGYKSVAMRLLGHKCEIGKNYPPMMTELDNALHEVLTTACLGRTNGIEISEHERIWEFTAAPLKLDSNGIAGVVIRLSSSEIKEIKSEEIKQKPDFLNAIPFIAAIVNPHGKFLAVNKNFISYFNFNFKIEITGKNIQDLINQDINQGFRENLMSILSRRSGEIECKMSDFKNYDSIFFNEKIFYDEISSENFSQKSEYEKFFTRFKIHARSIEWENSENILLIFEDITDLKRNHEQIHRVLAMDNSLGILNRYGLEHFILHEIRNSVKNKNPLSIILFDIENFKKINEANGYAYGDKILLDFSEILKNFSKKDSGNAIGRWHGDEFMMITRCSFSAARVLANEIREEALKLPWSLNLNIGVSEFKEEDGIGLKDFVALAYDSMAIEKQNA